MRISRPEAGARSTPEVGYRKPSLTCYVKLPAGPSGCDGRRGDRGGGLGSARHRRRCDRDRDRRGVTARHAGVTVTA
jgi:hypothetical protein